MNINRRELARRPVDSGSLANKLLKKSIIMKAKFGIFRNGRLVKCYNTKKMALNTFMQLLLITDCTDDDVYVVDFNNGIIAQN